MSRAEVGNSLCLAGQIRNKLGLCRPGQYKCHKAKTKFQILQYTDEATYLNDLIEKGYQRSIFLEKDAFYEDFLMRYQTK